MILSEKFTTADRKLLGVVRAELFQDSPILIEVETNQTIRDDGTLVLGCRAGPSLDMFNLFHEMSHLVEIDDARIQQYGWGFKMGREVNIPGYPTFYEPSTWQPSQREIRVMAYQANLMKHFGREMDFAYCSTLFKYMVDHYLIPHGERWLAREIERRSELPKYSFEAFQKEWLRKNELL